MRTATGVGAVIFCCVREISFDGCSLCRWYIVFSGGLLEKKLQPFKGYRSRDATTSLTFNNCTLCPHCIYVFCIYLRTDSDLCHLQHKLIGFYNPDEKCLQRGTDWVFKQSSLSFVCKDIINSAFTDKTTSGAVP